MHKVNDQSFPAVSLYFYNHLPL